MSGYLIYHPKRAISDIDGMHIYHDMIGGNQDPYIWNKSFLHTYCHITQMSPEEGDTNFWVSGDSFPNFNHLFCDLVFVVVEKSYWNEQNCINPTNPLVDSREAFDDHYRWVFEHPFKCRRRFTLKGHPEWSYQPQNERKELLDLVPILGEVGISLQKLRVSMRAGFASKPMRLSEDVVETVANWVDNRSRVKLLGIDLEKCRREHPRLRSPDPKEDIAGDYCC